MFGSAVVIVPIQINIAILNQIAAGVIGGDVTQTADQDQDNDSDNTVAPIFLILS
ncbi:MAG: hypothetical protein AB7R89_14375 [Dehalococcoidia bacterium]